ncbi:MAG TPA: DUF2147 domain-containing protein [Ideonella sp.]|uniref:DUF2147 domain-containing protein n=1 Tax=Ideonella sp. TaxID=1929293 RepID=UPI002CE3C0AD|nr:DUF2147 domain-containing protein [Ideonella sp.]HSI51644.1 DUF2147 domain-containing protein [Ideonella sp.]
MKKTLIALALLAAAAGALAQATPAGLWKTIDDETKQEKSLVRIVEAGGVYSGKVEKGLQANPKETTCSQCTDERKDQPIVGMTIIKNAKASADDKEIFEGGEILDPNNGKTYKLRLKMLEGGKKLEVRGYIGPFYRNQQWIRME